MAGSSQQNALVIEDDDEEEDGSQEAPGASQNYNEDEASYVLYGKWDSKAVGCRYYNGMVTMEEMVMREYYLSSY